MTGSGPPPPSSQGSPSDPPNGVQTPKLGDLFFVGTACAISVVGGGAIGFGLDAWLHTTPWLSFAGLAFGIVSAVLLCVAQFRKYT